LGLYVYGVLCCVRLENAYHAWPTPAADLVREIRQQMVATHSVVMETQRILQGATLSRVEALLDGVAAPASVPQAATPPPVAPPAAAPADLTKPEDAR
ncbi:hypothetical protein AB0M96_34330, partial [Streptomyces sp. NPDC051098]